MHCHEGKSRRGLSGWPRVGTSTTRCSSIEAASEAIENTHAPNEEADADLRSDYQSQREADQHGNTSIRPN